MDWINKVWEKLLDVRGEFSDDVMLTKPLFTDFVGFLAGDIFIDVSKGVYVLMEEHVEDIGF